MCSVGPQSGLFATLISDMGELRVNIVTLLNETVSLHDLQTQLGTPYVSVRSGCCAAVSASQVYSTLLPSAIVVDNFASVWQLASGDATCSTVVCSTSPSFSSKNTLAKLTPVVPTMSCRSHQKVTQVLSFGCPHLTRVRYLFDLTVK